MPICIECRYPVPQLYHVSSSSKPAASAGPTTASDGAAAGSPDLRRGSAISSGLVSKPHEDTKRKGSTFGEEIKRKSSAFGEEIRRKGSIFGEDTKRKHASGGSVGIGGGSKRTGRGGVGDVRLTQCPRCRRFADKYVEHDFVVLFIDLVLVKPQVYRHLLFNSLGNELDHFDPAIKRLGTLLLLFDVYLTWSSIEALPASQTGSSPVPQLPILAQYAFYLVLCALATGVQHLVIRTLGGLNIVRQPFTHDVPTTGAQTPATNSHHTSGSTGYFGPQSAAGPTSTAPTTPFSGPGFALPSISSYAPTASTPGPNAISTALFVSSCMQLFPILMVVWKYDDTGGQLARGVSWAVGAQNVEALRILLGCGYGAAALTVGAGALARTLVKRIVLGAVGLGGLGV